MELNNAQRRELLLSLQRSQAKKADRTHRRFCTADTRSQSKGVWARFWDWRAARLATQAQKHQTVLENMDRRLTEDPRFQAPATDFKPKKKRF